MNAPQNFRTEFNGFHREDVVRYLEYITAKHNGQVSQMRSEISYLQQQLEQLSNAPTADAQEVALLRAELEESMSIRPALEARCAGLERELEAAQAAPNVPQVSEAMELEAYRRAERMEREARERAEQIYHRTNGILADATCRVDAVTGALNGAADAFITQLNQLQEAVDASRQALQEAARTMGELRPEEG